MDIQVHIYDATKCLPHDNRVVRTMTQDGQRRDMRINFGNGEPEWMCNGCIWTELDPEHKIVYWWDDPEIEDLPF